jgi:hypothetical protein
VLLADRAIEHSDTDLAAAVAAGSYLDHLIESPSTAAPTRTVDSALVDVVRSPDDFQAQPRLQVALTGTANGARWARTYHVVATTADVRIERELGG